MTPLLAMLSPAGARAQLSVLIFHRVLALPDALFPGELDAARFDTVCSWLRQWFRVLPLDEATRRLREGTLPARAAAISFDDGYADNHDIALPILRRHGLNATFFVATGYLDGGCMWNDAVIDIVRRTRHEALDLGRLDAPGLQRLPTASIDERRRAIAAIIGAVKYLPVVSRDDFVVRLRRLAAVADPIEPMLTSTQLRKLRRAGMLVGAHTVSHPILARLDAAAARDEIAGGRDALQELLQERIGLFAYPNGKPGEDFNDETVRIAAAQGFDAAFTTAWGAARGDDSPLRLPRFTPWDRSRVRFGLRLAGNLWRSVRRPAFA